jgi:hypothetical protein
MPDGTVKWNRANPSLMGGGDLVSVRPDSSISGKSASGSDGPEMSYGIDSGDGPILKQSPL